MPKAYISSEQKRQIIQRADRHCEYCKCSMDYASNSFEMEHVFPLAADGDSSLDNLALACGGCNNHKHTKVDALYQSAKSERPCFIQDGKLGTSTLSGALATSKLWVKRLLVGLQSVRLG